MLNLGAKVNIINQQFIIECNFTTYSQLNKTQAYYYKAYNILLRIKNSQDGIREVTLICYKMANASPTITLGILGLKKA